jgi:hypothetical protein
MEATKRKAGRPKASPQTGPLVLEEDRRRVKIEVEISEPTADELNEYARWVELSAAVTTADAFSKTVQYALREVFRRDRVWQERRRSNARPPSPAPASIPALPPPATTLATSMAALPTPTPRTVSPSAPTPPSNSRDPRPTS